ncbi:hypothetical protein PoB_006122300 [Plakobranchus ocellatus]|uniref:Uncharacterized protein n=1 Tax=Plakobranchus ocellatus TaxID=259542 RepID=A0AAV4CS47_9GAST|nr:hypothetical protein PoB_006122300 [Plakobranchus ocellatus]
MVEVDKKEQEERKEELSTNVETKEEREEDEEEKKMAAKVKKKEANGGRTVSRRFIRVAEVARVATDVVLAIHYGCAFVRHGCWRPKENL